MILRIGRFLPLVMPRFFFCVAALVIFINLFSIQTRASHDSLFVKKITHVSLVHDLERELWLASTPQERIVVLVRMSWSSMVRKDRRDFALQACREALQSQNEFGLALANMVLAGVGDTREEVDSCMKTAVTIFLKSHDADLISLTRFQAGSALFFLDGNYVHSFRLLNQFLNGYSLHTDFDTHALAWNRLGEIYRILQNYSRAIECYRRSIQNARQVNLKISPLINIGTVYKATKRYDSSLFYYDKAMTFYFTENAAMKPYTEFRKAQVYFEQRDYSKSILLASLSMRQYDSLDNKVGIVLAASTLARSYFALGNYKDCILFGKRSIDTGKSIRYYSEGIEEACEVVAAAYEQTGNYTEANRYLKYYQEVHDKFFGPKVNLTMFNEQLKLELDNQELEKSILNLKKQQADETIQIEAEIIAGALLALIAFIFISITLYRRNKTIAQLNNELKQKSDEVLAQAEELRATNEEMEAMNTNLESLVRERSNKVIEQNQKLLEYAYFNAHKVRGPLARILGLINILHIELQNEKILDLSRMLKQAGEELDTSIRNINDMLDSASDG